MRVPLARPGREHRLAGMPSSLLAVSALQPEPAPVRETLLPTVIPAVDRPPEPGGWPIDTPRPGLIQRGGVIGGIGPQREQHRLRERECIPGIGGGWMGRWDFNRHWNIIILGQARETSTPRQ